MDSEKEFDYKQRAPEDRKRFDEKWDKIFGTSNGEEKTAEDAEDTQSSRE